MYIWKISKYQLQQQLNLAESYSIAFPSIATASVFKDRLDWKLKIYFRFYESDKLMQYEKEKMEMKSESKFDKQSI